MQSPSPAKREREGPAAKLREGEGDPRSLIREQALALGFDAVGFARAELAPPAREGLA
jgi:hypothetical protein